MRVALIASRFPVLSETFVLAQVTGLIERGHDVVVFAGRPPAGQPEHGVVARYRLAERARHWPEQTNVPFLIRAGRAAARSPLRAAKALWRCVGQKGGNRLARRAMAAVAEGPFDAIVCHFGNIAVEAQQLRDIGALRGKLVAIFHAFELTRLLRDKGQDYYDELFARADCIMPVSRHWADKIEALGCPAHKIIVHHMGVDCAALSFAARQPPAEGEPMQLLSVARLVEKKGIADAIAAVARLVERGIAVRYQIVGDGPLREELSQLRDKLGLQEQVTLLGARRHGEVAALLAEAHVLLAPSVTAKDGDQEGIPVSIMEAMARGLVVVSTQHTGIPELVEDGVSGYLVPERDVDALADRLATLAAAPQKWAEMGRAGRAMVEREFNQERLNDKLVEHLRAL